MALGSRWANQQAPAEHRWVVVAVAVVAAVGELGELVGPFCDAQGTAAVQAPAEGNAEHGECIQTFVSGTGSGTGAMDACALHLLRTVPAVVVEQSQVVREHIDGRPCGASADQGLEQEASPTMGCESGHGPCGRQHLWGTRAREFENVQTRLDGRVF